MCPLIYLPGEAVELEADRVTALAAVHVVAKGQDELQHLFEALAALHLLAGLQHGLHLGPDLGQPDVELFLVVQSAQPLFVVGDPENVFCVDLAYLSNSGK